MRGDSGAPDDRDERGFSEAMERLCLSIDMDERDLALAGYRRVMREIETVRAFLAEAAPDGCKPDGACRSGATAP